MQRARRSQSPKSSPCERQSGRETSNQLAAMKEETGTDTPIALRAGMCLQAFVEAFFFLAQRKFKMLPLHEQVASLIDLCEYHLSLLDEKRLLCSRGGSAGGRTPQSSSPQGACPAAQPVGDHPPLRTNGANKFSYPRHTLS
ncbi:Tubulin polyglutamylase TTLL11 [Sciurus carolinensis]|uniref:Tubulin polyglutamylase TTLL11 n=1 Tax=Sciurus carolinensis TaxID=30640 RepID=A0AA41SRV3_SCICA|nr:Tubulin polyglutamylase TTLL11 [Sciurus carolinensis]